MIDITELIDEVRQNAVRNGESWHVVYDEMERAFIVEVGIEKVLIRARDLLDAPQSEWRFQFHQALTAIDFRRKARAALSIEVASTATVPAKTIGDK